MTERRERPPATYSDLPDECDWGGCDQTPDKMVEYGEPEDYVVYCLEHKLDAVDRTHPGLIEDVVDL